MTPSGMPVSRIRVKMLVVVYPAVDQHEAHPAALRVVALAIVNSSPARR